VSSSPNELVLQHLLPRLIRMKRAPKHQQLRQRRQELHDVKREN
jgi:hypothetical protein